VRFQPSAHSYGVIGADQILATAQLTTAAAGAGASLSQTFRKRGRKRRGRRVSESVPVAPLPSQAETKESQLPVILGIVAVLAVIGGTAGIMLYKRKKQAQGSK
jgi:cobalamin biosynthesis Mg chelatase CobN